MLNTQKLLYVLPDLAYIAELLPDKKPYSYAIQSFKQVNGEFLNETEFIAENIVKLINKLEEGEEYFLILPDFLFTNTIVSVKETSDTKIKEKLTAETLPGLGLNDDSHMIETVVLNQLKGTTRVQLSAIEKSVLSVFKVAIAEKEIKIAGIAPLSWAVKSLVSLEPSISVLQLGTNLYAAQHYIGVDQATSAPLDDPEKIAETIKTLKGAEPSIQTVYVCSNAVIEEKLKEALSKILPIQQMAAKDPNEKIPSYVSQIIIASMRTMAIPDYSVPTFKLAKPTPEEKEKYAAILTSAGVAATASDEDSVAELPKPQISPVTATDSEEKDEETTPTEESLEEETEKAVETTPPEIEDAVEPEKEVEDLPEIEDANEDAGDKQAETTPEKSDTTNATVDATDTAISASATGSSIAPTVVPSVTEISPPSILSIPSAREEEESAKNSEVPKEPEMLTSETKPTAESQTSSNNDTSSTPPVVVGAGTLDAPPVTTAANSPVATTDSQDIDLKQFAQNGDSAIESATTSKPLIKNKSGAQHMMKMILITTGVFVLTVAIGIGVGLAILKYSGSQNSSTKAPVVEVEQPVATPEVTATPSPEASPAAELDKSEIKILVVNATTKAGYAGQIKTKLTSADFESVNTGNSKGDYEETGNFIYLKEENPALVSAMEEATELELTASEDAKVEDTQGTYDAVLVLAE